MNAPLERRRSIWVVDDSPTDLERVNRLLSKEHEVVLFSEGASAIERLSQGVAPDLILLDSVMPDLSGAEICTWVRRSLEPIAQIPILFLTGRRDTQDMVAALDAGANDYVAKPFVEAELQARVSALLRTRSLLERAERAEKNVAILLATAPDAIFSVDASGIVQYANDEALAILKTPAQQVIGEKAATLLPGLSRLNISIGGGEPLLPLPDLVIGDRTFAPSLRVLATDTAAGMTIALRDVTTQRNTERRRLDFYSIIAHDLRTPLSAMLLRLEMIFGGRHGLLAPALIADLRKIDDSVRSLVAMINDFLELARFDGVGHKIERAPVDLSTLVSSSLEDFKPLLDANGLYLEHGKFDPNTTIAGDRRRLVQVLANLIGNAIKFTPRGGTIRADVTAHDGYVEVAIRDTGRGIPKDVLPNIFERFSRGSTVQSDIMGTGLGLMIVREIIEAHGGAVGVASEIGQGSRFWFRLPR